MNSTNNKEISNMLKLVGNFHHHLTTLKEASKLTITSTTLYIYYDDNLF